MKVELREIVSYNKINNDVDISIYSYQSYVFFLRSHVAPRASYAFSCFDIMVKHSRAFLIYNFKRSFVLRSSEVIFSFLIKKSRQKAIEIEIAFFHSLGNPKGRTLDHFFYASHIRHNFPYKLIPISMS